MPPQNLDTPDVVLIGAGIMGATVGTVLKELEPSLSVVMFETLDDCGQESSEAWNNAGTGHAANCELRDGRRVNVHVDGPFVLNDSHLLIDAALHGAGLAMVMEDMVAPFIADRRLVRVLEDWSPPFSGYHLYYPNRRHPSPAFAALLEELRANSHL